MHTLTILKSSKKLPTKKKKKNPYIYKIIWAGGTNNTVSNPKGGSLDSPAKGEYKRIHSPFILSYNSITKVSKSVIDP